MNREIQQRLVWVKLFEETNDAGLVCRRCGISRPTLRKWWKRYSEQGIDGLSSQSKRPLKSPNTKINAELEALILEMRSARNNGSLSSHYVLNLLSIFIKFQDSMQWCT